ncbi:response regulator transcription factor [Cohnella nanjingensis]|uniref:Helix-turn-helix domain-containing protein n=1 Tax=Cohnella nanjingensis TaxID=1387779 RepID=A0A7X0VFU3_9BACL|nr:helix-turn-helix domain-containing protein [Cohnella nanjingensis]MBB6672412.1 helix-turn-helix domain-containing protein [Cohnella nanjingensis]
MYKAILVDDDVAVLEFLKRLVPWERLGFELAGEYTDALDAVEACQGVYPDLIVTDIGMPELDGLSFIRRVQSEGAKSRFVILSCHDEFQYAQQAVQLGVQDYILKETLTPEGIAEIIRRVKDKIEEDMRLRIEVDRLHVQANKSKSAAKEMWLREVLAAPFADDPTLMEPLREYGLNTKLGHYIPLLFRSHRYQEAIVRYRQEEAVKFIAENAAEELLREEPDMLFVGHAGSTFFLLYAYRKDLARNPYEYAAAVARRLQRAFAGVLKLPYSAVIGEEVCGGAGLKRQLAELLEAGERLFYADGPTVTKKAELQQELNREDPFVYHFDYAERFNRLLLEANDDVYPAVDAFVGFVAERRFQPSRVKQLVWKLALDLLLKLRPGIAYDKEKVQQEIGRVMHIGELRGWLAKFLTDAVSQVGRIANKSKKTEIVDAQNYIRLHLSRKITLEEAAEYLHLNPSYFSRLFKKETGENFIEFVNRMKMEKAMALISDSGKSVEEAAFSLGFDNKSYFIKLFKQHFGIAPGRIG